MSSEPQRPPDQVAPAPPPVYSPYPTHPPPPLPQPPRPGRTEGRATASLLSGIIGLILGIPLGIPGMALGPLAYFLGKSAVGRIDESKGELGGRSTAVAGYVIGTIATAVGALVTFGWFLLLLFSISAQSTQ